MNRFLSRTAMRWVVPLKILEELRAEETPDNDTCVIVRFCFILTLFDAPATTELRRFTATRNQAFLTQWRPAYYASTSHSVNPPPITDTKEKAYSVSDNMVIHSASRPRIAVQIPS